MHDVAIKPYLEQTATWPKSGRHIMAQYDETTIVVYQAFRTSIARYAIENQRFGGDFSFNRMSWIKPNFLWMMFRSGWAGKEGQEHVLAVRIKRSLFDDILLAAVPSSFDAAKFSTQEEWQAAIANSEVRLQWDPDHDPSGKPLERRAVQLGLRGAMLRRYGEQDIVSITDIGSFAREQATQILKELMVPEERVYQPHNGAISRAIGLDLVSAN